MPIQDKTDSVAWRSSWMIRSKNTANLGIYNN